MFSLEELQKMNKNELIRIIGNYVSDQEIWINQAKALEKQVNEKTVEIERLTGFLKIEQGKRLDLHIENAELQKQVEKLTEEKQQLFQANIDTQEQLNTLRLEKKRENAELQKRVDVLKAETMNLYFLNKNLEDYIDNHEPIWKRNTEQAVRDKTKEIILLLEDMDKRGMTVPFNMVLRKLKERCGVEVE